MTRREMFSLYLATIQKCSDMNAPIAAEHRQNMNAANHSQRNETDFIVFSLRLSDKS